MTAPFIAIPPMPAATQSADTYTDLNGLAALKKDSNSPQTLRAVAQQVDALFLQMMLKSMRDASADQGDPASNEMGMYQDMFDKQIALSLSQRQGLGLGALLTRQMSAAANATAKGASGAAGAAGEAGAAAAPFKVPAMPFGRPAAAGAEQPATSETTVESAGQFISQVMPTIRRAAEVLGVSPLGLLAQAALETGWGKRMARTAAGAPSLNLFGIKADDSWEGPRASANTVEFSGGVATQRHTAFRAYGSIEESVSDFARLLGSSPRYRDAVAAGADPQAYVESIGKSGYATDPQYANKLNDLLNGSTLRMALNVSGEKLQK
jgi:flagellar protein FlgJ